MAIFLRGNVWYFEYRTRRVRVVKSTGFRKGDKAKALAAFNAFKLGFTVKPQRSVIEKMLAAIYEDSDAEEKGIPLSSIWLVYEDWFKGKAKKVAKSTWANVRNETARLVEWCAAKGLTDVSDVAVPVARDYVKHVYQGRSNKTVRNIVMQLSSVWEAVGQIHSGVHNPWKAACPDNDGSAVRRLDFTSEEVERVLIAAKRAGHDWYLASMIALYTGLRYGDIALLEWGDINLEKGIIFAKPNKTRRSSGVVVTIPIAQALRSELVASSGGYVLPEHAMSYATRRKIPVPFTAVLEAAGVDTKNHTFHSWRHTANSRMAEAGISSEVRRMICGWTNDDMARHYDHAKHLKELQEAVSAI